MKKILLATTVLAMTATVAAAEVTVGGSAAMWLSNNGTDTAVNHSIDIDFGMSGETDGGLAFGASVTLQEDGTTDGPGSVFISGAFGKLAFGDVDGADAAVGAGMGDIGFDGLGVDNVAEQRRNDSASDVLFTYTAGSLTVGVSAESPAAGSDYSVGVKYAADAFSVSVAVSEFNGVQITNGAVGVKSGAVSGTLYAENSDDLGAGYGAYVSYKMDAVTLGFAYASHDASVDAAYGVDAAYDLGGGASVKGGIASVGGNTVADLGIAMSF